ncbi:MFS transporter (plasmid) [Aquamicrobium terrae]
MESTISAGSIARAPGNVMSKRRVVAAVTLGNALEFYDFLIYSFFAAAIGKAFFPIGSEIGSMLASLATFGVGFFFRPLGSIVLGAYADRRGRKAAMSLTLGLMALGTGIIAFAPTYAQIGVLAPALIVAGRILQGFSAGGEVGASTSMLAEAAPVHQRGFFISWQMASQGLAILVAALISFSLTELLDTVSLESWGWRVPFVIGMLIAPVGMYIRRNLKETFARELDPHAKEGGESAIADLASGHLKLSLMSTLIQAGSQITSYIFIIYLPTYAVVQLKMPASLALSAVVVSGIVAFLASPLLGSLSDRIGRKPLAWASRILSIAVAIPSFHLMNMQAPTWALMLMLAGLAVLAAMCAVGNLTLVTENFPARVRASGMGIAQAIGAAIFGGFAQFTATWLIGVTGDSLAPAYLVIFCCLISMVPLFYLRETRGVVLG